MAQKPDGKAARTERVVFTLSAAERISKAVRIVEAGDRDAGGLSFGRPGNSSGSSKPFRVCTFTGSWSISSSKTVTFKYQSTTPNTAAVQNDLISLPSAGTRNCVIGREGTAWHLINWQWEVAAAAVNATLTTAVLRFETVNVGALHTSSTQTFDISVATCSTA